jgi:hypothetical protein
MTAGINRFRPLGILLAGALVLFAQLALPGSASAQRMTPPRQDDPVEMLARDVERARSIRQVKDLQYSLTQYAQFGLVDITDRPYPELIAACREMSAAMYRIRAASGTESKQEGAEVHGK